MKVFERGSSSKELILTDSLELSVEVVDYKIECSSEMNLGEIKSRLLHKAEYRITNNGVYDVNFR